MLSRARVSLRFALVIGCIAAASVGVPLASADPPQLTIPTSLSGTRDVPLYFWDSTLESAEAEVRSGQKYILVVRSPTWCPPCKKMKPIWWDLRFGRWTTEENIIVYDDSSSSPIDRRFRVRGYPTLILLHRGGELGRTSGYKTADEVIQWMVERTGDKSINAPIGPSDAQSPGKSTTSVFGLPLPAGVSLPGATPVQKPVDPDLARRETSKIREELRRIAARKSDDPRGDAIGRTEDLLALWGRVPRGGWSEGPTLLSNLAEHLRAARGQSSAASDLIRRAAAQASDQAVVDADALRDMALLTDRSLGEGARVLSWLDGMPAGTTSTARAIRAGAGDALWPVLSADKRWADAGNLVPSPFDEAERIYGLSSARLIDGDTHAQFIARLHVSLLAAGRGSDAWSVVEHTSRRDFNARVRSAIVRTAMAAKVAERRHLELVSGSSAMGIEKPLRDELAQYLDAQQQRAR